MEALCWLLLAAIFIVIEIITLGLTTIWFAGGALFLIVSIVLLILTRPLAVKYLDSKTEKTNSEALIGQRALVTQKINNLNATGQAKAGGMEWTARAKEEGTIIPEGEIVTILEIQGVKLIVEPTGQKKENLEE